MTTITLTTIAAADGCVAIDTAPLWEAVASHPPRSRAKREGWPAFTLLADDEVIDREGRAAMERQLQTLRSGVRVEVFRNAGGGVTFRVL